MRVQDHRVLGIDENAVKKEAADQSLRLWKRMQ